MSDDDQPRADRPVTAMGLRAERLRLGMARAAGAKTDRLDPGLSRPAEPRDPELRNTWAIVGLSFGILALFLDFFIIPSLVAFVLCAIGLRRARALGARGKVRFGRRRALWGIGFAAFGLLGVVFHAVVQGLLS